MITVSSSRLRCLQEQHCSNHRRTIIASVATVASSTFPRDIFLIVRCEGSWVTGLTCDLFFKETRDCVGTHIWDEIRRAVTNSVTSRGDPFSAYVLVDIDSVGVAACNR